MPATFSVVLPYYNEATYLPRTLRCWLAQTRPPDQLILVDNGSTDGSEGICRRLLEAAGDTEVVLLRQPRPGKIHALQTGCARICGDFAVMADADTYYPPHYLALCADLSARAGGDVVSLLALPATSLPQAPLQRLQRLACVAASKVFRRQGFVGGHGQVLRADVLAAVGGFSVDHWRYVLLDHEILNRMFRRGVAVYHPDLWCVPSARRGDRRKVRWNLAERLLYHLTPHALQDWYFYRFLGPRLEKRQLSHLNLREQPWRARPVGTPLTAVGEASVNRL